MSVCALHTCMYAKGLVQESSVQPQVQSGCRRAVGVTGENWGGGVIIRARRSGREKRI